MIVIIVTRLFRCTFLTVIPFLAKGDDAYRKTPWFSSFLVSQKNIYSFLIYHIF
jgi:hypothetical protein